MTRMILFSYLLDYAVSIKNIQCWDDNDDDDDDEDDDDNNEKIMGRKN
jgi:hypothetical protein